jgi:hypothetical protein
LEVLRGKHSFVIDLGNCTGLDSTFMGMLMGLAKKLSHENQGCLHITNAKGRNAQLLRGLGVHYFCSLSEDEGMFKASQPVSEACTCAGEMAVSPGEVIFGREIEHLDLTKRELTEHCLEAHTRLCEAGQENQEKFQHVIELMEQKLVQLRP